MLVIGRKTGQVLDINGTKVHVLSMRGQVVRLGIVADRSVKVLRQEVLDREVGAERSNQLGAG